VPIRIATIMLLMATGIIAGFVTGGAYDIDLGQLFPQQVKITGEEWTEDVGLVQIEPGFVGRFYVNWVSHSGDLAMWGILDFVRWNGSRSSVGRKNFLTLTVGKNNKNFRSHHHKLVRL